MWLHAFLYNQWCGGFEYYVKNKIVKNHAGCRFFDANVVKYSENGCSVIGNSGKTGENGMIILGIDPGTAITGYGIIRVLGNQFKPVIYGAITTPAGMAMEKRLVMLYEQLCELIDQYRPEQVAVEELFFNQNVTTGITVGQARGVILLACAQKDIPIYEYTPLQVKQALVGYGRADKKQIQQMVKTFLGLREIPKPDDAADGLAIAICHTHYYQTETRRRQYDQLH